MTIEITFKTSPTGHRYALCRIQGYRSATWHGISVAIAERALRDGHVSLGAYRGHLAVPAVEPAAAACHALDCSRQRVRERR